MGYFDAKLTRHFMTLDLKGHFICYIRLTEQFICDTRLTEHFSYDIKLMRLFSFDTAIRQFFLSLDNALLYFYL